MPAMATTSSTRWPATNYGDSALLFLKILSSLPNAPGYFELVEFKPVAVLVVPPLGMFVYFLTIILAGTQTLVFALIAEFFSLRRLWLHMRFGAAAAAAGFMLIWPDAVDDLERWADMGIIAGAGLVAGLIYWLIAGRDAGFRRPLIKAIPGKV